MKIVVTGGSGLVGQGMQAIQYDDYYKHHEFIFLRSSDYNLVDEAHTRLMVRENKPDCVIHLAANVGGLYKNMNQKVQMFEDNLRMNMNVVRACHEENVPRFIGMLSTCIFPDKTTYPINEDMLHNGPPHTSNDAYAYAKRMLEVQCMAYNEQYNRNYNCIVPTNVYGEHDNYSLEDAHVIPALIHKCYLAKQNNEPFIVRGTGKPLRQFIYSKDLAAGTLAVMGVLSDIHEHCVIIPGDGVEYSIGSIAERIADYFDYSHKLEYDESCSDGQYKKTADGTLFQTLAPNFKFTPIEVGLRSSVNWFVHNYPNLRT